MTLDLPPLSLAEIMSSIALIGLVITFLRKPADRASADVEALGRVVREKAEAGDLSKMGDKVEGLEERVAVVESELQHLPDRETVHAMELSLAALQGDMKVLVERIKPIAATSARLEDWLKERAK